MGIEGQSPDFVDKTDGSRYVVKGTIVGTDKGNRGVYLVEDSKLGIELIGKTDLRGDTLKEGKAQIRAREISRNIPLVYDAVETSEGKMLLSRKVEGMTLMEFMSDDGFNEDVSMSIILELANMFEQLAEDKIYHQDLKPENVMFDTEIGIPYLVDFGLSSLVVGINQSGGTDKWMAPELSKRTSWDGFDREKAEIYSFGKIINWLGSKYMADKDKTVDFDFGDDFWDLRSQCLLRDPEKRPRSFKEVRERLEAIFAGRQKQRWIGTAERRDLLKEFLEKLKKR